MTKEEQNKRYDELDDKFSSLSDHEKDYVTWLTLDRLIAQYKTETIKAEKAESDLYYQLYLKDALEQLKRVREALTYKLW